MAKGYWIARVDVHDPDTYRLYAEQNGPVFARFGGRFLVRGGAFDAPEGEARERNVVLEFPTYEAALACYRSDDYQRLIAIRSPGSHADLIVIHGYDGPQPGEGEPA